MRRLRRSKKSLTIKTHRRAARAGDIPVKPVQRRDVDGNRRSAPIASGAERPSSEGPHRSSTTSRRSTTPRAASEGSSAIAKNLKMTVNGREFVVSRKSVSTLIEHLEPSPPDSAADYLRVVLETAIASDSRAPVKLLHNEERTLIEALRQLRRRRPLPDDLTPILYRNSKRRDGKVHRVP